MLIAIVVGVVDDLIKKIPDSAQSTIALNLWQFV